MPGGSEAEADEERRKQRKDAGVSAILHEVYPVRYWDHDLGPAVPHAFWAGQLPAEEPAAGGEPVALRDLTPDAGPPDGAGEDFRLSPDGRLLARTEDVPDGPAGRRSRLVLTETASGETRPLVDDPLADVYAASFSPDGTTLVCVRETLSTYTDPPDYTLLLVDVATGAARELTEGFDRWPSAPQFSADGSAVYFLADDDGRHAIFRIPVSGGAPVRLTGDGAYSDLQVARDGSALYALRSAYDSPSVPVRLDPERALQDPPVLPNPGHPRVTAGHAARAARHRPRRRAGAVVAGAPRGRVRRVAGAPAALDPRRPADELELVVLAVDALGAGRPRIRRADAQPGALAGVRPGLRPPRLG